MIYKFLTKFILVCGTKFSDSEEEQDRLNFANEFFGEQISRLQHSNGSLDGHYEANANTSNEQFGDKYLKIIEEFKDELFYFFGLKESNIKSEYENSVCNKRKVKTGQRCLNDNAKKQKTPLSTFTPGSTYHLNPIDFEKFNRKTLQNNELCNLLVDCLFVITNYYYSLHIFANAMFKEISTASRNTSNTERQSIYRTITSTLFIKQLLRSGCDAMEFYIEMHFNFYCEYVNKEYEKLLVQESEKKNIQRNSGKGKAHKNLQRNELCDLVKLARSAIPKNQKIEFISEFMSKGFEKLSQSIFNIKFCKRRCRILLSNILPPFYKLGFYFDEKLKTEFNYLLTPPHFNDNENGFCFNYQDKNSPNNIFVYFLIDWLLYSTCIRNLNIINGKLSADSFEFCLKPTPSNQI